MKGMITQAAIEIAKAVVKGMAETAETRASTRQRKAVASVGNSLYLTGQERSILK